VYRWFYFGDIITWLMQFSLKQHWLFVMKMSDMHKSTSPSESQVKNWRKAIGNEEKLGVISQREAGT
jgi:hypothetical protein